MAVNIDTSGLQFFLKAVIINIKRLINRCIDSYNSLFQLDPENAREIHNELGDDLEKKGNHVGAIKAYHKTIGLRPDHVNAYQSLGFAYEAQGLRDEAVKYFKKSMDIEQRNS